MKRIIGTVMVFACSAVLSATPALATPGSGFTPGGIVNGHFGEISLNTAGNKTDKWGLIMKTLDDTDMGVDRLTVAPGGYSGWHAHPGPVFVTVTAGAVDWTDGSDPLCTTHRFNTGDSYIEEPYDVHNVRNASMSQGAEFIAITVKPEGFVGPAFRLDRPGPNNCEF